MKPKFREDTRQKAATMQVLFSCHSCQLSKEAWEVSMQPKIANDPRLQVPGFVSGLEGPREGG